MPLRSDPTPIPGLLVFSLPVHGDNRGWFKENWQRQKMVESGLPDFEPIQQNVSFNAKAGTTRGIHAEPWDKFVSVTSGRVFGAWVDLRDGPTFGTTFSIEIDPTVAVYVPRGVGNAYQTLEDQTTYSYLVNDHWSPSASYTFLNLADETAAIDWPISLAAAELSDKDRAHPRLAEVEPVPKRRTLVVGANGQVGRALREIMPDAEFATRSDFDVANGVLPRGSRWSDYDVLINASAYTKVDLAETPAGRAEAWQTNVTGVANLVSIAIQNRLTIVHISSDYVFDGEQSPHVEDEPVSPLGVYGQTKAAGDAVVFLAPRHYIVRTSWVIGDGPNFVATMKALSMKGVEPRVVADQTGRLTFASEIAAFVDYLLETNAPYGTYNLSNDGVSRSWAEIARRVFELSGSDPALVKDVTTADFFKGQSAAPRPRQSTLDLSKTKSIGYFPQDADDALIEYLK